MTVFYREAGSGPGVVCLHSNASSSGQWRGVMDLLAPKFHVLAADSYGAGKSPPWPAHRKIGLRDEVALLDPVIERAGEGFSLVGHSYGGAIALIAALTHRNRVRALALYEPTLFAIADNRMDVEGVQNAVVASTAAFRAGDEAGGARHFIDFWMGAGSFDRMPERNRAAIAEATKVIQGWRDALFEEPTPVSAFASLDVPVLLVVGSKSPLSSRAVANALERVLPNVERVELEGLGHMAPVTHPAKVNPVIAAFLERVANE